MPVAAPGLNRKTILLQCCLIIAMSLAVYFTVYFFYTPGTDDVITDLSWISNAEKFGIIHGFEVNEDCYPPLIPIILYAMYEAGSPLGLSDFAVLKTCLLVFLTMTSLVTFLWTRNAWFALLIHMALILNSMALAYLDIFMAPTFIASFWALSRNRLALFSILFTLTCCLKFQPLIIAPFLLLYLIHCARKNPITAAARVIIPAGIIAGFFLSVFYHPLMRAFDGALAHPQISANAFNVNWIITYFIRLLAPEKYGPLMDGQLELIIVPGESLWMRVPRFIFYGVYGLLLIWYAFREKTFINLVFISLTGYLAWFTLCTGVHENHLFLASILGMMLWWLDGGHKALAITLVVLTNLNPFLFYGLDGMGMTFNRVVGIDVTVIFSVVVSLLFARLLVQSYRQPSCR
jgi:hypothetical protein